VCRGQFAIEDDLTTTEQILGSVGICARVPETAMDAVTALSGSGPAYVFYVAEAMIEAGVAAGLSRELAQKLAVQTIWGAGTLLAATGEEPSVLRQKVTSPGGTTEAALKVMGERKLMEIFGAAIQAAARRSNELSVM
jgi:pyrroline-5-carboxylate reductase